MSTFTFTPKEIRDSVENGTGKFVLDGKSIKLAAKDGPAKKAKIKYGRCHLEGITKNGKKIPKNPVRILFTSILTNAGIKRPEDRGSTKAQVSFSGEQGEGTPAEDFIWVINYICDEFTKQVGECLTDNVFTPVKGCRKLCLPRQTHISEENEDAELRGQKLDVPIYRLRVAYSDEITGKQIATNLKDKTKMFRDRAGKIVFPKAKVDGKFVNSKNVQDFITKGSECGGVVDISSVNLSGFGISLQANTYDLIVKPGEGSEIDTSDFLDEDDIRQLDEKNAKNKEENEENEKKMKEEEKKMKEKKMKHEEKSDEESDEESEEESSEEVIKPPVKPSTAKNSKKKSAKESKKSGDSVNDEISALIACV
jgi:hypothetical protein